MKLETSIKPRKDGLVNVEIGGAKYSFATDEDGVMVCDIENEEHIRSLLALGDFMPAYESDFEAAAALAGDDGADDGEEGNDEGGEDQNAAPIEEPASAVAAAAPAKVGHPRKAK